MKFNFLTPPDGGRRNNGKSLVTVQNFFAQEGNAGYMTKATFNSMITQMRDVAPQLLNNYKEFFSALKDGIVINNTISKQKHTVSHEDYYHVRFRSGMQRFGCTIYDVENISQFIKDYASGLITPNFSLEDLIEESSK